MTKKDVGRTSEAQYGAASKLEKGFVRYFQTEFYIDVKAVAFGQWTREDLNAYVEQLGLSYGNLNIPVITDDGVLITTGKDHKRVCFIDKGVFRNYLHIINV